MKNRYLIILTSLFLYAYSFNNKESDLLSVNVNKKYPVS